LTGLNIVTGKSAGVPPRPSHESSKGADVKYTIAIIGTTALFTILGLVAAWVVVAYSYEASQAATMFTFVMFCFGGAAAGIVVGCVAAALGRKWDHSG
jgi:hypothetical protein